MAELELRSFQLVGGTAMALQVGHRVSIDLDLFGAAGPLDMDMLTTIVNQIGTVETLAASQNIVVFKVNGVKADFVNYRYALLRPIVEAEGVRMVSLADIAPMKLAAIAGRGRKRYFTDLFS
ncbi:MAG: nucleotidyl transferase AbiEii/AbiGii toxin family protein [Saprospiraceae bacterium]